MSNLRNAIEQISKRQPEILLLEHAWFSYLLSSLRLTASLVVFMKLNLRVQAGQPLVPEDTDPQSRRLEEHEFTYVSYAGLLLYSTSTFDSFLSDTTKFLLLMRPDALGKSCVVPIGTLTSPKSRAAILNKEVAKKVRALSTYSTIEERIQFIREKFGLGYQPPDEALRSLRTVWNVRNEVAHDQSAFTFELDDTERHRIIPKGHKLGVSSELTLDLIQSASHLYEKLAYGIYQAVLKDYFNASEEELRALYASEESFRANIAGMRPSGDFFQAVYGLRDEDEHS